MSKTQSSEPTKRELLERIERLEQQSVTRDELTATDDEGRSWSFSDFLGMGLTRRQALGALFFLMVYGGSLVGAITYATDPAQASHGTGDTGDMAEQANPLANVWTHHVRPGNGASVVDFPDGISTEQARIGTVTDKGKTYRLIDRETPSSGTSTIQFTGLDDDTEYKLFLTSVPGSGDIFARINGDGATTGNYNYWDASGTKQTGQNEFLIVSLTATSGFATNLFFGRSRLGSSGRTGFQNALQPARAGSIDDFGREGGHATDESLSSITLTAGGDFPADSTVAELWERDYS